MTKRHKAKRILGKAQGSQPKNAPIKQNPSEQTLGEQTLGELLTEIWQARIYVLSGLFITALGALLFLGLAIPHYQASTIIAPASPMQSLSTASRAEPNRNVQSSQPNANALFTRFEAMYKGPSVAALLLRDQEILRGLIRDQSFRFSRAQQDWSPALLAEYIARRITIDPIGETNLRSLRYLHADPVFASLFLQRLHETTDGLIRHAMRADVNERIHYLENSLNRVTNPEHRRALTDLLLEQERLKMLVSIEQSYAASIVEPAASSAKTRWPDSMLIFPVFMLAGALIGFVIYTLRVSQSAAAAAKSANHEMPLQKQGQKQQARKMSDWIRRDTGNSNEKIHSLKRCGITWLCRLKAPFQSPFRLASSLSPKTKSSESLNA